MSDDNIFEFRPMDSLVDVDTTLDRRDTFISQWLRHALSAPDPEAWVSERIEVARRRLGTLRDAKMVQAASLELDAIESLLLFEISVAKKPRS